MKIKYLIIILIFVGCSPNQDNSLYWGYGTFVYDIENKVSDVDSELEKLPNKERQEWAQVQRYYFNEHYTYINNHTLYSFSFAKLHAYNYKTLIQSKNVFSISFVVENNIPNILTIYREGEKYYVEEQVYISSGSGKDKVEIDKMVKVYLIKLQPNKSLD